MTSSGTYRSFTFRNLRYTVTEADYSQAPNYYDTTLTRTAQTETYSLMLGDNGDTTTVPLENVKGRVVTWTDTEAGGRVVFTNTRQTADVTVKKELVGNTSLAGIFNFTAAYSFEGSTTDLGAFSVTSGTDGKVLEDIPVGAELTVTEVGANLIDYTTTATVGETSYPLSEGTQETDGGMTYQRALRLNVENTDSVITFTNTLKSYPVTFYKVDQDKKAGVPSYFTLASSTGTISERLYPAQSGTGEFFPGTTGLDNTFYVGTYTLTETFVGADYLPLDGPVTLTLSAEEGGKLTSSNTDYVQIEQVDPEDVTKGFQVTVYNQKIVKLKIEKVLSDPILSSTKAFQFHVQYEYELLGNTVTYDNEDNLLTVRSGSSTEINIPVNAALTVTEVLSASDADTYDTSIVRLPASGEADTAVEGTAYTYSTETGSSHEGFVLAENAGDTLIFTNTRKTVDITVKKVVDGDTPEEPDENYFTFTATLLHGAIPIEDYPIDLHHTPEDDSEDGSDGGSNGGSDGGSDGGTEDDSDSGDGKTGTEEGSEGQYMFHLKHEQTQTLTVPIGSRLTIAETGASTNEEYLEDADLSAYTVTVKAVYQEDPEEEYSEGTFTSSDMLYDLSTVPSRPVTVTFTNGKGMKGIMFRKVDGFGQALGGAQFSLYEEYSCETLVKIRVDEEEQETVESATEFETAEDETKYNVSFEVPSTGIYYMKETNTVPGYETNDYIYRLVIGPAGALVEGIQLPEEKEFLIERMSDESTAETVPDIGAYGILNISSIRRKAILRKTDDGKLPLEGAEFEILRYDRTPVESVDISGSSSLTFTSGEGGVFFCEKLPFGTYYVHETTVPSGYSLVTSEEDGNWYTLSVDENGAGYLESGVPKNRLEPESEKPE